MLSSQMRCFLQQTELNTVMSVIKYLKYPSMFMRNVIFQKEMEWLVMFPLAREREPVLAI